MTQDLPRKGIFRLEAPHSVRDNTNSVCSRGLVLDLYLLRWQHMEALKMRCVNNVNRIWTSIKSFWRFAVNSLWSSCNRLVFNLEVFVGKITKTTDGLQQRKSVPSTFDRLPPPIVRPINQNDNRIRPVPNRDGRPIFESRETDYVGIWMKLNETSNIH